MAFLLIKPQPSARRIDDRGNRGDAARFLELDQSRNLRLAGAGAQCLDESAFGLGLADEAEGVDGPGSGIGVAVAQRSGQHRNGLRVTNAAQDQCAPGAYLRRLVVGEEFNEGGNRLGYLDGFLAFGIRSVGQRIIEANLVHQGVQRTSAASGASDGEGGEGGEDGEHGDATQHGGAPPYRGFQRE